MLYILISYQYNLLDNLSGIKEVGYYSHSGTLNKTVYSCGNILVYSFKLIQGTLLEANASLLIFVKEVKVKANIIGVVDSGEIAISSDINKNAIIYGSSKGKTTTKDSHCFGIVFVEYNNN